MTRDTAYNDTDNSHTAAYAAEHGIAWATALAALVLGAIGLLVGFGIIGDNGDVVPGTDGPDATAGASGVANTGGETSNFQDGLLWLLPAISMGLVSWATHRNEHHSRRATRTASHDDSKEAMFKTEHGLAYLMAGGSVAAAALTLLVGFDVFDRGNVPQDGYLWGLTAVGLGVLTGGLHSVRHHQLATDEDAIVRIIDERSAATNRTPVGERVVERERPGGTRG